MKRGSIDLARSLCCEIAGPLDEDFDGMGYGSVDIAEILSAEVERLKDQRDELLEALEDAVEYLKPLLPDEILAPHLAVIKKARGEG